ncbi:MAG: 2,3-bisphosphoglycerate-independent phosphoglycerate mutase [Candidatus Hydrogenedentota bacterium]
MKTLLLVPDGMADYKIEDLNNQTPLAVSRTENFNKLAKNSEVGLVRTIPLNCKPGSEIANATIIGQKIKKGLPRGSLECISLGYNLKNKEVAYRVNFINVDKDLRLIDYSGGHPCDKTANILIDKLNKNLGIKGVKLLHSKSYRNILILQGDGKSITYPPHDNVGRYIKDILPRGGKENNILLKLIFKSYEILGNEVSGINMLWPWGGGKKPRFVNQAKRFKIKGAIISAVDLLKGIGILSGFDVINVPGATGFIDTDYDAKALYTIDAFKSGYDLVYLHIEAPDEASHMGNLQEKIRAIETIDKKVLGKILEFFENQDKKYQVLILPDHCTPIRLRVHTKAMVPYLLYRSYKKSKGVDNFNEISAERTKNIINNGWELIEKLLG